MALMIIGTITGKMKSGTVSCEKSARLAKTFPASRFRSSNQK